MNRINLTLFAQKSVKLILYEEGLAIRGVDESSEAAIKTATSNIASGLQLNDLSIYDSKGHINSVRDILFTSNPILFAIGRQ